MQNYNNTPDDDEAQEDGNTLNFGKSTITLNEGGFFVKREASIIERILALPFMLLTCALALAFFAVTLVCFGSAIKNDNPDSLPHFILGLVFIPFSFLAFFGCFHLQKYLFSFTTQVDVLARVYTIKNGLRRKRVEFVNGFVSIEPYRWRMGKHGPHRWGYAADLMVEGKKRKWPLVDSENCGYDTKEEAFECAQELQHFIETKTGFPVKLSKWDAKK